MSIDTVGYFRLNFRQLASFRSKAAFALSELQLMHEMKNNTQYANVEVQTELGQRRSVPDVANLKRKKSIEFIKLIVIN